VTDVYNNITLGDIVSELELRRQSLHIYNNTLKGVPTGNIAADGTVEYLITEANGGTTDVALQDQFTERLSIFLGEVLAQIISISGATKNIESLNIVTDGVVPIVGNFFCLQEDGHITQSEIISVVEVSAPEYTIGLSVPLDHDYANDAGCTLQNVNMDVDGSGTPVMFQVGPRGDYRWDITRINIAMVLASAGDDGLFGNLAALTTSQYFRKENSGHTQNLFDAKDNSDFRLESGGDVNYFTRSGGQGDFGMSARITFNGSDKSGVVIRVDGATDDKFVTTVRSNLTGLNKYRIKIQGHVVED